MVESEILDNQEMTSETINNIAIDLGVVEFNKFANEKSFGADELNAITADLVTKGILLSGDVCKPSYDIYQNKLNIKTGTIVFNNGLKIRIKEEISFDLTPNTYIYALYNSNINTAEIVMSEELPIDPNIDFVQIANVNGNGSVIDKRQIACMKAHPNALIPEPYTMTATLSLNKTGDTSYVEVGTENFRYLFYNYMNNEYGRSFLDLSDNMQHEIKNWYYYDNVIVEKSGTGLLFTYAGDKLTKGFGIQIL